MSAAEMLRRSKAVLGALAIISVQLFKTEQQRTRSSTLGFHKSSMHAYTSLQYVDQVCLVPTASQASIS